jgi:D-glycero-D-manno-heptose 1,7-bisphosphate phosphatase
VGGFRKKVYSALQESRAEVTRGAVFLDRDGTINEEKNFIRTPEELTLIPGAARAIRKLNDRGIPTCVISNQSGVARGYLTETDLIAVHERLRDLLKREGGSHLDRIYYCPHHPTEGIVPYNVRCTCRKPGTAMLEQGSRELNIGLERSFVVGDRIVDVQVGQAVGATSILVLTGYGTITLEECKSQGVDPDAIVPSLVEAVDFIMQSKNFSDQ